MQKPALLLEQYFFTEVHVSAVPEYSPDDGNEMEMNISPEILEHGKAPLRFQMRLHITSSTGGPYVIDLKAVGYFKIDERIPREARPGLVYNGGGSILYGATREFLLGITGRGPWGPTMIQAVSFPPSALKVEPTPKRAAKRANLRKGRKNSKTS
jgi:preprotein translocase subunit SecB